MPYKSLKQERFFHSSGAKKAGISAATVKEFDQASKGKKLPLKVPQRKNHKSMSGEEMLNKASKLARKK